MKKTKNKANRTVQQATPKPTGVRLSTPNPPIAARERRSNRLVWLSGLCLLVVLAVGAYYALNNGLAAPIPTPLPATPTVVLTATAVPLAVGPANACRRHPRFAPQLGFSVQAVLATNFTDIKGMGLLEPATETAEARFYQDPTWDDAGWLGHLTFDPQGNVYVFPAPRVSLVDNPPERQNTIYRVDTDSGMMTTFITLTAAAPPSPENPFGLMGMTYDCDTDSLYASTVSGSTRAQEVGKLVHINRTTREIVGEYTGIDPYGIAIYNHPTGKRLYFGLARASEVYSLALDATGAFVGDPQLELTLPDPTFKAWRIAFDADGAMQVRGLEFDYNLIATSDNKEVAYTFRYDSATSTWQLSQ